MADIKTIKLIKMYKHLLTYQQYRTLMGQCLSGDSEGAKKGLKRILSREKK